MHNLHLTLGQIAIGTLIVLGILYIVYSFECYPAWWAKLEDKCPMFRFGDSRQKPVDGPPRISLASRPRDPSDFMIAKGIAALAELDMLDPDEGGDLISPMEGRVIVQMIWAAMWTAWGEERKEQFFNHQGEGR